MEGDNKETINPALAAGNTSDIVNDETDVPNNKSNGRNSTKGNTTRNSVKANDTANVQKTNITISKDDTKNNSSYQEEAISKTDNKLNSVLQDGRTVENSTQFGILRLCSKMLDWWSYGYNGVWKLLKSGKCPMPWLTSARLHCNIGKHFNWLYFLEIQQLKQIKQIRQSEVDLNSLFRF